MRYEHPPFGRSPRLGGNYVFDGEEQAAGFDAGAYSVERWSSRDPTAPWCSGTRQWPASGLWAEGGCCSSD